MGSGNGGGATSSIRARMSELRSHAPALRSAEADAVREAIAAVLDPDIYDHPAIARDTGLSVPMVRWGLQTSMPSELEVQSLQARAAQASAGGSEHSLCSIVLAGNIFTASIRAVLVPLLCRVPIMVKAPTVGGLFAEAWANALHGTLRGKLGECRVIDSCRMSR